MRDHYRTIDTELRYEPEKTKGSRFIATAAPVRTADQAETLIGRVRSEFPDATHHCFAYRIGAEGQLFRFGDDGEPGGSAGRPILAQIEGHDLTDLIVVVTRYFGGTKLGVGGLVRAYGGAAGSALSRAQIRTVAVMRRLIVTHGYDRSGEVQAVLAAANIRPLSTDYGEKVRFVVDVPVDRAEDFVSRLNDRTGGRCVIDHED